MSTPKTKRGKKTPPQKAPSSAIYPHSVMIMFSSTTDVIPDTSLDNYLYRIIKNENGNFVVGYKVNNLDPAEEPDVTSGFVGKFTGDDNLAVVRATEPVNGVQLASEESGYATMQSDLEIEKAVFQKNCRIGSDNNGNLMIDGTTVVENGHTIKLSRIIYIHNDGDNDVIVGYSKQTDII